MRPDYSKPVRCLRFNPSVAIRIAAHDGWETPASFDGTAGWAIEVDMRFGIARVWSTRRLTAKGQAEVTTYALGPGCTWTVAEDVETSPVEARKP